MGKNTRIKGFSWERERKKHVFQSLQSNCHWSDKKTLLRASVHSAGLSELFNKQLQGVMGVMFILRPGLRGAALKAMVNLIGKYICFIKLWCWVSVLIPVQRSSWWSAGGSWPTVCSSYTEAVPSLYWDYTDIFSYIGLVLKIRPVITTHQVWKM